MTNLTEEHVKKVIEVCNPMEKAMILHMFNTGSCPYDIRRFKIIDFTESISDYLRHDEDSEQVIGIWNIDSRFGAFRSVSTTECNRAIVEYLNWRVKETDPVHPYELLFVNAEGEQISPEELHGIFKKLNNMANLEEGAFTVHALHRLHKNILVRMGEGEYFSQSVKREYIENNNLFQYFTLNEEEISSNIIFNVLWGL